MLLISPQRNRRAQLGAFAAYVPLNVPFGIGFIAAYLLKNGKNAAVLDEEVTPINDYSLEQYIKNTNKPYIFGISCLTPNIGRGYEIANILREKYPDSKIIFGGIHPTVLPEEVLKNQAVDIVVRNEGEVTALNLYERIKKNEDYRDIAGISYRIGEKVMHNRPCDMVDMNNIPIFPYHLYEKYKSKYNFGFLSSSRGCPFECIFCSQRSITGRTFRFLPTDKTIETLDILINKYNQNSIVFSDDNFVVNKKRVIELCNAICENKFNEKASFMCQLRGDSVAEEMLPYLKKANFTGLSFGVETASERLMKIIKKAETVQDNIDGIRLAKKYGFKVSATFIFGLPTETSLERQQAYKLAKELDIDYVRFNNATPYPGTELYEIALKEGRLNVDKDWGNLNACGTLVGGVSKRLAYVPTTCAEKELMSDVFWYNIKFSLRPKKVLKMLFDKTSDTAGWIAFPEKWYLKKDEWGNLIRLITEVITQIFRMGIYYMEYKLSLKLGVNNK